MHKVAILMMTTVALVSASRDCRFGPNYTQLGLQNNSTARDEFLSKFIQQEAKFIKGVGFNQETGLTLDDIAIDSKTGMPIAASNHTSAEAEALHIAVLAMSIYGDDGA